MPALPEERKKLSDGLHICTVIKVETKKSKQFDCNQEEVTLFDHETGEQSLFWITHTSPKAIDQAEKAGMVTVNREAKTWDVVISSTVQMFIAGGKVVSILPAKTQIPTPASLPA